MRMNEDTIICGDKVILVPYRREHVQTYHEWMKSPELLESTASEPLSYEEELDMQQLTFILLARPEGMTTPLLTPSQVAGCKMIGDVNLFAPDGLTEDLECEIMLAESEYRGKGYAKEALALFLTYVVNQLDISPTQFIVRIGSKNANSIALFGRLGFGKVRVVEVWDEVEMRWGWDGERVAGSKEDWPAARLTGRVGKYSA